MWMSHVTYELCSCNKSCQDGVMPHMDESVGVRMSHCTSYESITNCVRVKILSGRSHATYRWVSWRTNESLHFVRISHWTCFRGKNQGGVTSRVNESCQLQTMFLYTCVHGTKSFPWLAPCLPGVGFRLGVTHNKSRGKNAEARIRMSLGSYELCSCALVFMEQRFFAWLTPWLLCVGFWLGVTSRRKESCLLQLCSWNTSYYEGVTSHMNESCHVRMNEHLHAKHTHTHTISHAYTHTTHTPSRILTRAHTYTYTYTNTYTHTLTHKYTHSHPHTDESWDLCSWIESYQEEVTSRTIESCHVQMSHVTCVGESHFIKKKSRHIWLSHVTCERVTRLVFVDGILSRQKSRHIWMSHVTCELCSWNKSCQKRSHVTHDWVMSPANKEWRLWCWVESYWLRMCVWGVSHDSFVCVWHDSFVWVWHDSFVCVTCGSFVFVNRILLSYYGVASDSRIDTVFGFFCKGAL